MSRLQDGFGDHHNDERNEGGNAQQQPADAAVAPVQGSAVCRSRSGQLRYIAHLIQTHTTGKLVLWRLRGTQPERPR
jgi:hypothetical protein